MTGRRGIAGRQPGGRFFSEHWIELCSVGVVIGYGLTLVSQLTWNSWRLGTDGKPCRDMIWIWLSGQFAASGNPAGVYDPFTWLAARTALFGTPHCTLVQFDNPPVLLFFTYPLALLPYWAAFVLWVAGTLGVYLAAIWAILPRRAAVVAALAPCPVFINVILGHNAFLTAGLLGLALAFLEQKPWLSGVFLGLLTYKPQFGILFPLALVASRDWRALCAATAASLFFAAAAAAVFGGQTWPSFFAALADRAASLDANQELNSGLVSVLGFLRTFGVSPRAAWAAQGAVSAAVALLVLILWARPVRYPLKAAAVAAGSLLATPHAFGYDACILAIAGAFLVKDGLAYGLLPGERVSMLLAWAALFRFKGPFPAVASLCLVVLVVRRVWCGREGRAVLPASAGWQIRGEAR